MVLVPFPGFRRHIPSVPFWPRNCMCEFARVRGWLFHGTARCSVVTSPRTWRGLELPTSSAPIIYSFRVMERSHYHLMGKNCKSGWRRSGVVTVAVNNEPGRIDARLQPQPESVAGHRLLPCLMTWWQVRWPAPTQCWKRTGKSQWTFYWRKILRRRWQHVRARTSLTDNWCLIPQNRLLWTKTCYLKEFPLANLHAESAVGGDYR